MPDKGDLIIKARYLGNRDDLPDQLAQARATHGAAVSRYQSARREARNSVANRVGRLKKKAKAVGYCVGLKLAKSELSLEYERAINLYKETLFRANSECLNLALDIAYNIISENIQFDHNSLSVKIEHSLNQLLTLNDVKISVNSCHKDTLERTLSEKIENNSCKIVSDQNVAPGDALVQSSAGKFQISWLDELNLLRKNLENTLINKINSEV